MLRHLHMRFVPAASVYYGHLSVLRKLGCLFLAFLVCVVGLVRRCMQVAIDAAVS
jgi:hypothetical protein